MMFLFLPVFFRNHMESVFLVGILTSVPSMVNILLDIPSGNLIQRASARLVMFAGMVLLALPGIFYFFAFPLMFFVGKFFEGVSKTLRWESGWYMAMENSSEDNESESLSVFVVGKNFSNFLGPILGGVVAFYLGFRYNLVFWAVLGFLAAFYFYKTLGISTDNLSDSLHAVFRSKTYRDDWHHLRDNWDSMGWAVFLILLQSLIYSFFWVAVPLLLYELGANYMLMGALFGVFAIPKLFQVYFGKISDYYGNLKTVSWVSILLIILLFAMGVVESLLLVGILLVFSTMFSTALSPALHSYFDERSSNEFEGEMIGFLEFFKHIGQALGPSIAGYVASVWSISASFFAAGGIGVFFLMAVLFVRFSVER